MPIVGCYSLHLYCETQNCPEKPHRGPTAEFDAEFGSQCRQSARMLGWKLDIRKGTALCPTCAKRSSKEGQ